MENSWTKRRIGERERERDAKLRDNAGESEK